MPFNSNEELPKGVKSLPESQQTKWRKIFNAAYEGTCKDREDRDECASRIAWSKISDKYKGKSSPLAEFSMVIKSATHNKQENTLRWKAVASDTDEDFYHDNMSLELFNDFVNRIQIREIVPEAFRSSFWQGGLPYLSVSHYPDLEGKAVPGIVEKVFVDGNQLRAYGQFNKTKLGLACYHAVCEDLYAQPKKENPIRISIAFLDWAHVHKSNGFEFERESIDDICPECVMERIKGEFSGKIFKKGQLVHLALTRVPANERTRMEVEKSMTTRKEDAISIIGEELAEEIDEEARLIGKSQALVIKTDNDDDEAEVQEISEEETEVAAELPELRVSTDEEELIEEELVEEDEPREEAVLVEEAVTKKESDCEHPPSHYLVVEDPQKPTTWHLRVKNCQGEYDHGLMAKARAALESNFRGHSYQGPNKSAALEKLKKLYKREGMDWEKKSVDDIEVKLSWIMEEITKEETPKQETKPEHELDSAYFHLRSAFDEIRELSVSSDEKLRMIQDSFNEFANEIISRMRNDGSENKVESDESTDLVQALSQALANALEPVSNKLDLLLAQRSEAIKPVMAVPERRSITPTLSMQSDIYKSRTVRKEESTPTPKLREIVRRTVGLQ